MAEIYIGGIYGGREIMDSRFHDVVRRINQTRARGEEGADGSLDIVFHVPGSVDAALGFQGIRTGRFSRRARKLQVQIAVPAEMVASERPEIVTFVVTCLRRAIRLAAPVFKRSRIPYAEAELLERVDAIEKSFVH